MKPAVFLDRDGTLMEEVEYCRDPAFVKILPGVLDGLAQLRAAGFVLAMVTNQSGLGRGWIAPAEYEAVHQRLLQLLGPAAPDATYMCPDHPERPTPRRKPGAAMLHEAAHDLALDLGASWLIGDKASDALCAQNAGVRALLVQTGYGASEIPPLGTAIVPDFAAAVHTILTHSA